MTEFLQCFQNRAVYIYMQLYDENKQLLQKRERDQLRRELSWKAHITWWSLEMGGVCIYVQVVNCPYISIILHPNPARHGGCLEASNGFLLRWRGRTFKQNN